MFQKISLKGSLISLIKSIDMFNYLLKNHHRRVAIIAYNLGLNLDLSQEELKNLVYAASLHDIGALSVTERDLLIKMDVENPQQHEIIGSAMLKSFSPFKDISNIIRHHHIKWSDRQIIKDFSTIPRECFILHLADRIEILIDATKDILPQVPRISTIINTHNGTTFAPWCIEAFNKISVQENFWLDIDFKSMDQVLDSLASTDLDILIDDQDIEALAITFARVIDYRSPFTASHSTSVAHVSYAIAELAGLSKDKCNQLKIAGYLHDIGKIAIPNELIEKNTKLTDEEFEKVKLHSYYTYMILSKLEGLEDICNLASKHHEKHDGTGYPYHITENNFPIELDILAYADIFTSLSEDRPYRKGLSQQLILDILKEFSKSKLSHNIYDLIQSNFDALYQVRTSAFESSYSFYHKNIDQVITFAS